MSARPPSAPPKLPGFEYLGLLGSGGFADVFRYRETSLDREVAVKVLLHGLPDQALTHFRAEANVMAKLSSHYSIVTIFQAGVASDGRPFLVMEVCKPGHLGTRLKKHPFDITRALGVGIQIAGAVETAHRLGVLHRDIKPANILFTEFGRPALTDFGIASSADQGRTHAFSVAWAPPEQIKNEPMGPSGDVYALAGTVWAMLAGRSPFELPNGPNDTASIADRVGRQAVPPTGRPDVPESLERILRTAMAKSPGQRYASALEFARALQGVQAELHQSVTTIDVRDERASDDDLTQIHDTGTRVTGFVSIDPDGGAASTESAWVDVSGGSSTFPTGWPTGGTTAPPARPVHASEPGRLLVQHGRGSLPAAEPVDFTALPVPEVAAPRTRDLGVVSGAPGPDAGRSSEGSPGRRAGLVGVGVAGVAALAVGVVWILNQTPATTGDTVPSVTARPADPIGNVIPQPAEVTASVSGDQVTFMWRNPDPKQGDIFPYRVPEVGIEAEWAHTSETTVTVPHQSGRTCLELALRRADGRESVPLTSCTE